MKKTIIILTLLLLFIPTLCLAEENEPSAEPPVEDEQLKQLEQQLQGVDMSNIQNNQTIDLREKKEPPGFLERYWPDIIIIIGAVGVIEGTLWSLRAKKRQVR
ncbi:hypothetical protein ACFL2B_02230 [Patescibacteria group bacterium]